MLASLVVDYQLDANLVLQVSIGAAGQVPEHVGPVIAGCEWYLELVTHQSRVRAVPRIIEEDLPLIELDALLPLGGIGVVTVLRGEGYAQIAGVRKPSSVYRPVDSGHGLGTV